MPIGSPAVFPLGHIPKMEPDDKLERGRMSALFRVTACLLDQLQYKLLHLVGLGERGHAGLFQD